MKPYPFLVVFINKSVNKQGICLSCFSASCCGYVCVIFLVFYCCITNHHKFSGLKQYKLTILRFWRSEVQTACPWTKIKVLAGLCSFLEPRGESVSLTSYFLEAVCIPGLMTLFFIFKANSVTSSISQTLLLTSCTLKGHL